jgi:methionyl-tRNA formyltransferase
MGVKSNPPFTFFGTGPVAAESLERLAKNFIIEAVITKPRPAHHRGETPVLDVAEKLSIPVFTASNRQGLDRLMSTHPVKSELAVLIDFGIIVSEEVIDYFPLGILNSHFSVLPDLRGADPITFAILSGQKQTGVSLMFLVEAMDEGPLVAYSEFDLPPAITTPELTQELIALSDVLLINELPRIFSGQAKAVPQTVTSRNPSYSRRLTKQDGVLNWHKAAAELEREIRAFYGWPGSSTKLAGKEVTVTKAHVVADSGQPGVLEVTKKTLTIFTAQGGLAIDELKPAGKQAMPIQAFLAGYGKDLA